MRHYQQHDFAAAIPGLQQAAALDPEAANIAFFLGACDLLTGRTDAGIRRLRQVVALGDTPYLEESRLLLAKTFIALNDLPHARAELQRVIDLHGELEAEARRLSKELTTSQ
jgi:lipopolysaccharide biosynthesis regulator YciM